MSSPGGLGPADHLCWGYDGDAELAAAARSFLEDGLALGERLLYAAGKPREALLADLAALPGRDELLESGGLAVTPTAELYDLSVPLDADRQLAVYSQAVADALAAGFTGVRVVADITPLVVEPDRRAAHVRWEHVADRWIAQGNPFTAMCAFDRRVVDASGAEEVACVHPLSRDPDVPFHLFAEGEDLAIGGDVDLFGAPLLRRVLPHVDARGERTIDLRRVGFVDHHGLVELARHAGGAGGPLTVRGASPVVRRVWEVLGLSGGHEVRWT